MHHYLHTSRPSRALTIPNVLWKLPNSIFKMTIYLASIVVLGVLLLTAIVDKCKVFARRLYALFQIDRQSLGFVWSMYQVKASRICNDLTPLKRKRASRNIIDTVLKLALTTLDMSWIKKDFQWHSIIFAFLFRYQH